MYFSFILQWRHPVARLNHDELHKVALGMSDYEDFNRTLDNILITRVPGTEGHRRVRTVCTVNFILKFYCRVKK